MRTTLNTMSGKRFRFNNTIRMVRNGQEIRIPARFDGRFHLRSWLDPSKTRYALLRDLNDRRVVLVRAGSATERLWLRYVRLGVVDVNPYVRKNAAQAASAN